MKMTSQQRDYRGFHRAKRKDTEYIAVDSSNASSKRQAAAYRLDVFSPLPTGTTWSLRTLLG